MRHDKVFKAAKLRRSSARETASIARMRELLDLPDLDHRDARRREFRGERACLVHVLGLDDEKPTELLLGLGKRADAGGRLAVMDADGPRRRGRLQRIGGDVVAAPSNLLGVFNGGV